MVLPVPQITQPPPIPVQKGTDQASQAESVESGGSPPPDLDPYATDEEVEELSKWVTTIGESTLQTW